MALPFATLLATNLVLDPIVGVLHHVLGYIFGIVHNYGWSLLILAGLVKIAFWPLNTMQFKAMKKTQQIAPQLKALQARYKNDKEKLNQATMALYKETGANPLASCLPLLLQMPILISLYYAVLTDKAQFATQGWLWIGTAFAQNVPSHILAANLSKPDYVLLALYVVSMYFQVRLSSPALDPQQAQQQKIMAFVSPAMVAFLGFKYSWPSALIIYWLSFNVFTMAQQFFLMRKYRDGIPLSGGGPAAAAPALKGGAPAVQLASDAPLAVNAGPTTNGSGGSRSARKRRSSRR
ncbi:MAG: membrane protein insertase YidC [Candidatus Eremiobacteraeota bacterium]|nr:membrane protein insertase YidC [Candidatus Eremiobacteraeota bacterium]